MVHEMSFHTGVPFHWYNIVHFGVDRGDTTIVVRPIVRQYFQLWDVPIRSEDPMSVSTTSNPTRSSNTFGGCHYYSGGCSGGCDTMTTTT